MAQAEAERDGIRLDQEAIEANLRLILREEVLPEFVEAEFERVMAEVFKRRVH